MDKIKELAQNICDRATNPRVFRDEKVAFVERKLNELVLTQVKIVVAGPTRFYIKSIEGHVMCDYKTRLDYALAYCVMNNWAVVGFEDADNNL